MVIPPRGTRTEAELTLESIALRFLLATDKSVAPAISSLSALAESAAEQPLLRTFSCVHLDRLAESFVSRQQRQILHEILGHWTEQHAEASDPDAKFFEQLAHSNFARAVLAELPRPIPQLTEDSEEIGPVDQGKVRTAKIKAVAAGFLPMIQSVPLRRSEAPPLLGSAELAAVSQRIVARLCAAVLTQDGDQHELTQQLARLLAEHVAELSDARSAAGPAHLAATALSLFPAGPLNCGFQRRGLLITSPEAAKSELSRAFKDELPLLRVVQAPGAPTYLLREGNGLHPLHLGARLAEYYPDIDEAASRLHTRSDIDWEDLRNSFATLQLRCLTGQVKRTGSAESHSSVLLQKISPWSDGAV